MHDLDKYPKTLRRRFSEMKQQIRGRIRVIDGTDGGWTLTRVAQAIEELRQDGFFVDVVSIDYDDYLIPERTYKGDGARRMEFDEIYRKMRLLAVKLDVIWWTAAQGTRDSDGREIVTGRDAADDIGKIKKVFLAIGIGKSKASADETVLYVCRHRLDKSRLIVRIPSDFTTGLLYDPSPKC